MKIKRSASAGTRGVNDIYIEVTDGEGSVQVELDSCMMLLYGEAIEAEIRKMVSKFEIDSVKIKAEDFGALDYTIQARMETALKRACQGDDGR